MRLAPSPTELRRYRWMCEASTILCGVVALPLAFLALMDWGRPAVWALGAIPACSLVALFIGATLLIGGERARPARRRAGLLVGLVAGSGWGLWLGGWLVVYATSLAQGRGMPQLHAEDALATAVMVVTFFGALGGLGVPLLVGLACGKAWWRLRSGRVDVEAPEPPHPSAPPHRPD